MQTISTKPQPVLESKAAQWAPVLLIIFFGCAFLLPALHLGVGTSPDSVAYLGAARNLADGKGLTIPFGDELDAPLTQFPPFYSVLLAVPGLVGIDPLASAGAIQLLLFIGNAALVFIVIRRASAGSTWAPLAGLLVLVLSPSFLLVHQMGWSEGLFILLVLLAILSISAYLQTDRTALLLAGSAAAGLAALTRFVGAAYIAALVITILLFARGSFFRRAVRGLWFGLLSCLPLGLWLVQRLLSAGESTTRQWAFHPAGVQHFHEVVNTLVSWLLIPADVPGTIKIGLLLLGLAAWAVLLHRQITTPAFSPRNTPVLGALVISILAYGLFLWFSLTFLDANIPLDERILSPVLVSVLIVTMGLLGQHIQTHSRAFYGLAVLLLVFAAAAGWHNLQWSRTLYFTGGGFNSPQMRDTAMVDEIQAQAEDAVIYSNAPEAVYLQTGKPALRLPRKVALMSQQTNQGFEAEMARVKENLLAQKGIIVYYAWVKGKATAAKEDLLAIGPFSVLVQTPTGTVYRLQELGE
jgi:hypothetical protein